DLYKAVANFDTGDHKLKVGAEINKTDIFNLFVQNATGTLVFRSLEDLENGLLSPGEALPDPDDPGETICDPTNSTFPSNVINGCTFGAFGNFSRTGDVNDAAAKFKRTIYSMYFQDDWRVNDRLNAVAGVRMDMFDGPGPDVNPNFTARYGFDNTTGFSDVDPVFLPRLGFTYDLNEFSMFRRAKLTGGVGIFSGGDPLVWFANAFQNNGFGFSEGTTGSSSCPDGQISVVTGGQFTGLPECFRQAGINGAAAGSGDTQSVDPDIKLPTVWRANLGFQSDFEFGNSPWGSGWRVNLDYIYSYYKNPFTIVDLSQTPDIRKGLDGFTIDGRPIYAAIDPTDPDAAGCNAVLVSRFPVVWENVTEECFNRIGRDDELMLTNSKGYHSHIASVILSKDFDRGILTEGGSSYFNLGYAYTASQDRRNMFRSTAGSNYDATAAFDRQNPDASRGFYGSKHNITFSGNFREEFLSDLATTLGVSFVARSGRPYSLTFTGGSGVFNDSASGSDNALLYIPTGTADPNIAPPIFDEDGVQTGGSNLAAVQKLVDFAKGLDCAKKYLGRSIKRNTCENDWYFDLDLRFAQEIPGPGRLFGSPHGLNDKITLYAMFDNFLNFLNNGWNIQHRREFNGLQDVANIGGVDSEGRYIISGATQLDVGSDGLTGYERDEFINTSSSLWRVKLGVSYKF
ncbi:MAG: TonB-dependent receptor, partial [Actinomycetota bacterium]|nr:TonB-dependent receptor [Actinomycetota bacterium]